MTQGIGLVNGPTVDSTGAVPSSDYGVGIPTSFTQQTSSSRSVGIQKGQHNNFRMRPQIFNEHVETARQVQSVVTSTNIVGQIFKASQDNINGLSLTLENAAEEVFDDFEGYADSAALQAAWIASSGTQLAELETTLSFEGDKSMKLPGGAAVNDEWERTFTSADFTGYTGEFRMYQTNSYSQLKFRVFVRDSIGNTSSTTLVIQSTEVWESFQVDVGLLEADGATAADLTDIVGIGFRLEDRRNGAFAYIDEMISVPPPGSVDVELWDMGTTLPATGVDSLDDGTQYVELGDRGFNSGAVSDRVRLEMVGGKRNYILDRYVAGVALEIPDNTLLNVNNYYAIVIRYVDTDVSVYGANTSFETKYYTNGYAFTAPDESTAITRIGDYNDVQFTIFSTADVYINTLLKFYDAVPGNNAGESVYIEDKNMDIIGIIAGKSTPGQELLAEFKDRTFYFPKGGKFEINMDDDRNDDTTQINLLLGYIYEPPTING